MDVTVTVTSSEVIGNIQFQVEALTAQQYRDQAPSCQSGFSLPGDTDAEADCKSHTHGNTHLHAHAHTHTHTH